MACIGGLNNSALLRLKHTKSSLQKKTTDMLDELMSVMNPEKSYTNYRTMLKQAVPPVIPYIGVFLSDLTMLDENQNYVNGLINFEKRRQIYKTIRTVELFQQNQYRLYEVAAITTFVVNLKEEKEDVLYQKSLNIEPKNAEKSELQ